MEKCNFDNILSHMVLDRLDGVVAKTDVQNVLPPQSKPTAYAGEYNVFVVDFFFFNLFYFCIKFDITVPKGTAY